MLLRKVVCLVYIQCLAELGLALRTGTEDRHEHSQVELSGWLCWVANCSHILCLYSARSVKRL